MPPIIPKTLPAYDALYEENVFVMHRERAALPAHPSAGDPHPEPHADQGRHRDADARLLANTPLQVHMTPAADGQPRGNSRFGGTSWTPFTSNLRRGEEQPLRRMIITGAPVEKIDFEQVDYWPGAVRDHGLQRDERLLPPSTSAGGPRPHCTSTMASAKGNPPAQKMFGVFEHKVTRPSNPLVRGFDEVFYAPHSRHTGISRADVDGCKALRILPRATRPAPS